MIIGWGDPVLPGAPKFTASTKFEVTGPAAADARAGKVAYGTFGTCSGGVTPWGTILSGEENFNGYYAVTGSVPAEHVNSYKRYGVPTTVTKSARQWSIVDPRSTPKKRTMLGRLKHEGATTTITADGRIAVYLGDDEKGGYIYKFVSADKYDQSNRQVNSGLLGKGTLYVGKFTGDGADDGLYDGTGTWIPPTSHTKSYVEGMSVQEVLINTRMAGDKVGATRMDRPEDVERSPVNGRIYAALTNNDKRGGSFPVDEANPLATSHTRAKLGAPLVVQAGNRNGYILEIGEEGDDAAKTGFYWTLFLVCGDPAAQETYFGGFDKSKVSPITCPDNVAFDGSGNLWISTDGNVLGSNDGILTVPVAGQNRGQVKQFLSVPFGSEACGPLVSDDDRTAFVAVQHPRRDRRRDLREAHLDLAAHRQVRAPGHRLHLAPRRRPRRQLVPRPGACFVPGPPDHRHPRSCGHVQSLTRAGALAPSSGPEDGGFQPASWALAQSPDAHNGW